MWELGVAHRDIKPANLLVRDGRLVVIDTAFAEVRPSPWRQAVDLANMMLVLGLRTDAERVYRRARLQFTDEEIAEAFAATDRKSTRLNSSHANISYAVFCLKKKDTIASRDSCRARASRTA